MTREKILRRMAILCSKREYTTSDIRNKLISWKVAIADVDYIVKKLVEEKYIDELRYSRSFTHDKFHINGWGRIKIASNLKAKSIPDEIIKEVLLDITDEENRQRLREIIIAKIERSPQDADRTKLHVRTTKMCLQHGFEQSLVIEEMNDIFPLNDVTEPQADREDS